MTPAEMAQLHRSEPTGQRAWSEAEFSAMLSASNASIRHLRRRVRSGSSHLDEAELFLIMTKPEHRKQGLGTVFWQRLNSRRYKIIFAVSFWKWRIQMKRLGRYTRQMGINRLQCVKTTTPSLTEAMLMQSSWKNT